MKLIVLLFFLVSLNPLFSAPKKKEIKIKPIDDQIDALFVLVKEKNFTASFKLIDDIQGKSISPDLEKDEFLLQRWYDEPQIFKLSELKMHIGLIKTLSDKCDKSLADKDSANYKVCTRFGSLGREAIRSKKYSVTSILDITTPYDKAYEAWMKKTNLKEWNKLVKEEKIKKQERSRLVKKICAHQEKVKTMGRLMEFEKKAGVDFGYNNPEVIKDSKVILIDNNDKIFEDLEALAKISYDPFTSRECYLIKKEEEYYY